MLLAIDCSSASLETVIRLSKILLQIIHDSSNWIDSARFDRFSSRCFASTKG